MDRNLSVGCEARSLFINSDREQLKRLNLDHVQLTIPNVISLKSLEKATEGIARIIHSNLLNTMGVNNWADFEAPRSKIRQLRPKHVIEHFTLFRSDGLKRGIHSPARCERTKAVCKSVENLNRWQDLLGVQILLENAPVSERSIDYFEALGEVLEKTGSGLALDVPHLMVSISTLSTSERESVIGALKPMHLHLGGVATRSGFVTDNHNSFALGLVSWALSKFSDVQYCTLEQGPQIPFAVISDWIEKIRSLDEVTFELPSAELAKLEELANQELARDQSIALRLSEDAIRFDQSEIEETDFRRFEQLMPFFFPLMTTSKSIESKDVKDALSEVSSLARAVRGFSELWKREHFDIEVAYGKSEGEITFSRTLDKSENRNRGQRGNFHRFNLATGEWLGLAIIEYQQPKEEV